MLVTFDHLDWDCIKRFFDVISFQLSWHSFWQLLRNSLFQLLRHSALKIVLQAFKFVHKSDNGISEFVHCWGYVPILFTECLIDSSLTLPLTKLPSVVPKVYSLLVSLELSDRQSGFCLEECFSQGLDNLMRSHHMDLRNVITWYQEVLEAELVAQVCNLEDDVSVFCILWINDFIDERITFYVAAIVSWRVNLMNR